MAVEKQEFAIGDVVRLKSGGPKMTINGPSSDGADYYECVWFSTLEADRPSYRGFKANALKKMRDPEKE
jgi:uncharacterized protein YodC (DUF2158 family)